jgi:uncharacterized membrane protein
MTQAHLHLILNHLPIVGIFFSAIILLFGLLKKNRTFTKLGLLGFVVMAVLMLPVYFTGEAAEHVVEEMPGSSHDMIHEHEDLGFIGLIISLILGAFSWLIWFFIHRNRHQNYSKYAWMTLVFATVTFFFMMLVATHGGQIRRPELRTEDHEHSKLFQFKKIETYNYSQSFVC